MPAHKNPKSHCWLPSRAKQDSPFEIHIDAHSETKIYTSGSTISGFVTITAQTQIPFEDVQINLIGTTSTCGHAFQYGTPFITHTFMQLQMPISASTLPPSRILEVGRSYSIPFVFVVPDQLSAAVCGHQNTAVWERHLRPPPSIGVWGYNDLTGGSARVDYTIRARLVLGKDRRGKAHYLDGNCPIKVFPIFPEQPPLHISPDNSEYCLVKTKTIRTMMRAKMGSIRASATQPKPIVVCLDELRASESQIPIDLEYIPVSSGGTPPIIRIKSATIETFTSFWLGPDGHLPDHHQRPSNTAAPIAPWSTSHPLVLEGPQQVTWGKKQHLCSAEDSQIRALEPIRIKQDHFTQTSKCSSSSFVSQEFAPSKIESYKASLLQSFKLPTEKLFFLPTFYSCLLSRTYRIRLTLAVAVGTYSTKFSLVLPLQVAVQRSDVASDTNLPNYTSHEEQSELTDSLPPPYHG
ncbi:uncharacterized protein FTOL_03717 [Fusarium torulosum]|uniref:Arrestin-like N-terminal domain-containing protein n=1 Tax=Fusarium torulosum TaxID=33205 RepID=A0AAE8M4F2_9HYPO|nr:uncharacterized protein FTOL_03717 [Fusarium torulosum]